METIVRDRGLSAKARDQALAAAHKQVLKLLHAQGYFRMPVRSYVVFFYFFLGLGFRLGFKLPRFKGCFRMLVRAWKLRVGF